MNLEIRDELAELEFLDAAALDAQPAMLVAISERSYRPGEQIYRHGEPGDTLFIVRKGLVKLMAHLPNGQSRIVRLHKPGSTIGMDGLMDSSQRHTAIAVHEVDTFLVPHAELQRLKEQEPLLYIGLLEKWHEYLTYADTWITDFSTGKVRGRVSRLIRFLARFDDDTGPQIVELLTTEEMAEVLGVTPESVSRVVAEFKREGILDEIENNPESLFSCDLRQLRLETQE
jgi:CRP/FNR family transcriptional regulator